MLTTRRRSRQINGLARDRFIAPMTAPSPVDALLLILCLCLAVGCGRATAAGRLEFEPLRVAVYDLAPYGSVGPDGEFQGVSVELWRRVAEEIGRQYKLTPVAQMDAILAGLEQGRFDAAIGAITITPDRAARVDFSYPAHRSGVAVALRKEAGPISALVAYGLVAVELSSLIAGMLGLLLAIGVAMWFIERPSRAAAASESSVVTLRDGIYWAVVTMTTVGYGDKTPKTPVGRFVAIVWMLSSVALVSLLSASLVSRLTAERVESSAPFTQNDLAGKRLAAVAFSSGAEYLDAVRLHYAKYGALREALAAVAEGDADAVVNSVGALRYMAAARFPRTLRIPNSLLAPAYMAIALPENSPLKKPIDRALMRITGSPEWRSLEDRYFGKQPF
jgi:ABC-type amino acid transport substrate-binding protein